MNHKQKLGYTLLGAGIMAVGITIGQFITPNIEAESNGVFDKITCRELEVVDENGNKAIVLASDDNTNGLTIYDRQSGTAGVELVSWALNSVTVYQQGKKAIQLLSWNAWPTNQVTVYDMQENSAISLFSGHEKNAVVIDHRKGRGKRTRLGDK